MNLKRTFSYPSRKYPLANSWNLHLLTLIIWRRNNIPPNGIKYTLHMKTKRDLERNIIKVCVLSHACALRDHYVCCALDIVYILVYVTRVYITHPAQSDTSYISVPEIGLEQPSGTGKYATVAILLDDIEKSMSQALSYLHGGERATMEKCLDALDEVSVDTHRNSCRGVREEWLCFAPNVNPSLDESRETAIHFDAQ